LKLFPESKQNESRYIPIAKSEYEYIDGFVQPSKTILGIAAAAAFLGRRMAYAQFKRISLEL